MQRHLSTLSLTLLVVFTYLTTYTSAHIEHLNIENDDRQAFLIESFGYEPGGVFQLDVHKFNLLVLSTYEPPAYDAFKIAFVLQRSLSEGTPRLDDTTSSGVCFHENLPTGDPDIDLIPLNNQKTMWGPYSWSKLIDVKGDYHLYFSNCEADSQIILNATITEYNMVDGEKMYLSQGESSLPTWYFVLAGLFFAEWFLWSSVMLKGRAEVKAIHWLMLATVTTKFLSLVFQSLRYHFTKWHGYHNFWFAAYYVFAALKGTLLFCVIVLIGTGWSYLKPFLTERDKHLMLSVIVAQAILNIAMVVVGETAPGTEAAVLASRLFFFFDLACCVLILLPIVWSIKHLRQSVGTDFKDTKATRSLERLRRFRTFYLVTVAFIYFTRIIVFLLQTTLPFEITWMANVFSEVASLLFYAATGILFAPGRKNPYISLAMDDADSEDNKYDHHAKGHLVDIQNDNGAEPIERL